MRYPNLRYGNPTEFAHYAMGIPLPKLARMLRRDERTVRDWLSTKARVPWWVPEIMRLKRMESAERHRQMGFGTLAPRLGIVTGNIVTLATVQGKKNPQVTDLRLDDFDQVQIAL